MWRFIVGLLATVGTLTLLGIGGCAAFLASAPFTTKALPQNVVLSLDLRDVPSESGSTALLRGGLFGGSRDIIDTVQLLWQAADDPRVVGMFVDIGDESAGLGRVQELRQAIAHFRGKGKFAVGFAESLGSGGTHFSDYYLASALEQIWLQPSGGFAVAGLAIETPFLKDGLDRLGVRVEGGKRYEYKSAPDTFTDTAYPPPARENLQQLLDSLYGQFVSDVARERNIEPAKVRQLINSAPFDSEKARQERLVDRIGYRGDALDEVTTRAGKSRTLATLSDYANDPSRPKPRGDDGGAGAHHRRDHVGIAQPRPARRRQPRHGRGRGRRARPGGHGQGGQGDRAAHRFAGRHLSRGRRHRRRGRARPRRRQAGDRVDGRRRGIGRLSRRPARRCHRGPAHHHHGLDRRVRHLAGGDRAAGLARRQRRAAFGRHQCRHVLGLPAADHGAAAAIQRQLDEIYADFTRQVGEARKLDGNRLDAAARGRVFSGIDAKKAGLIDELGGLQLALSIAKAKAGIDESRQVELRAYPPEHRPLAEGRRPPPAARRHRRPGPTVRAPREVRDTLARFGIVARPGNVRLPPLPPLWR